MIVNERDRPRPKFWPLSDCRTSTEIFPRSITGIWVCSSDQPLCLFNAVSLWPLGIIQCHDRTNQRSCENIKCLTQSVVIIFIHWECYNDRTLCVNIHNMKWSRDHYTIASRVIRTFAYIIICSIDSMEIGNGLYSTTETYFAKPIAALLALKTIFAIITLTICIISDRS